MSKKNSATSSHTSSKATTGQVSAVPKDHRPHRHANSQHIQNVILIWLDGNIDNNNTDCANTVTQLRNVVNDVNTFNDGDQSIKFIHTITNNKVYMIISGALGQHIVPRVHDLSQVDTIFIFCGNKKRHEQWAKEWLKIKGIFTEISPICEALKQAAQQCEQNTVSISFEATTTGDASSKTLDRLDPSFMYTQILKEILLTIKFEQHHIQEFIDYCREQFAGNQDELNNIKKFERTYRDQTPIWWYTSDCFLYRMLNLALRLMDVDVIVRMGFFLGDLHRHIQKLHAEQYGGHSSVKKFTVYRGQGLSNKDFEELAKNKGGLIAFNNFLTISKNRDISLRFADQVATNPDLVGILFIMQIDPFQSTTPFASIRSVSCFHDEDEFLLSMHSVFRINDIKQMSGNNRLYEVKMTLTNDNDHDLRKLTDQIRKESFPDDEGWCRLGSMLIKMGQFDKAQDIYEVLLDQTTDESEKAPIYLQLGSVKDNQGEYQEAITFYEKAIKIYQSHLPPNHPDLAVSYMGIGTVYNSIGDYSKALSFHEKALEIQQKSLPYNHPHLASSYNNIGTVYYSMGVYPKALSSYEKALIIGQQSLVPNHPDLGASYMGIGNVYNSMGDYLKALSSHEKALEIRQESLPPNHPHLATSYNNIGMVYENMRNYSQAHSYYERAVNIGQQLLPPNHPNLQQQRKNLERMKKKL